MTNGICCVTNLETAEKERDTHIPSASSRTKEILHLAPTCNNPSSLKGALEGLRHVAKSACLRDFVPLKEVQREWMVNY